MYNKIWLLLDLYTFYWKSWDMNLFVYFLISKLIYHVSVKIWRINIRILVFLLSINFKMSETVYGSSLAAPYHL